MMDSFPKRVYYNGPHTSLIHQKLSKKHNTFPMNELLARLPKIGIKVFKEFDNYTLTNLRIVSNSMKIFFYNINLKKNFDWKITGVNRGREKRW